MGVLEKCRLVTIHKADQFSAATEVTGLSRACTRQTAVFLLIALWVLPIVGVFFLVWRYGVDVPFWDDWMISFFLTSAHARGYPLFSELFAQHNESRKFFPRLIFLYLAQGTHWNLRAQMFFNAGVMVFAAIGLIILIRRRITTPWRATLVASLANVLLFSPGQWENWLWGIQLVVFIPTVALVWALVFLDRSGCFWLRFSVAALLSLIATYSYANGMSLWAVLLPSVLLCAGRSRRRMLISGIIWTILAAGSIVAYFHGYQKPPQTPPFSYILHHPVLCCDYFLCFLGNGVHVATSGPVPALIGIASLLATALFAARIYGWRRDIVFMAGCAPWFAMINYTLITAVVNAVGRAGWGIAEAMASKYQTFAIPLYIALAILTTMQLRHWKPSQQWVPSAYFAFGAVAMLLAIGLGDSWQMGMSQARWVYHHRLPERACVQFYYVAPETEVLTQRIFPYPELLPERIRALNQAGLLSCGLIESSNIGLLDGGGLPGRNGAFQTLDVERDTVRASGWASLDQGKRPAEAVLLTVPDDKGVERVFAIAENDNESTPEGAEQMGKLVPKHSGWFKLFSTARLPHRKVISAWAYDSYAKKAYRLATSHLAP
jgi:hypothetical protein